MSKFSSLIQEARKPENQQAGKQESQKSKEEEKLVNLSIKVPLSSRRHWVSQAKAKGTSITQVISEALNRRFGKP